MKLNKFKYVVVGAFFAVGGMTTSCDTLDIDNLETYDESMVWHDANLASAYVNNLYAECFTNWSVSADGNSDILTGMPWYLGTITETGSSYKKWTYTEIRHINEAIKRLEASTELDKSLANNLLGQAYFMRAYMYYWMVLHHGGVPYIKVPQDKDKDDLFVKRNTTPECFQFMVEDLDKAISMLRPGSAFNKVRIGKEIALLVKSRVALYEASFERYHKGTPRVPGEAGWPGAGMAYNAGKSFNIDSEVDFFLTEAMSAAKEVADNHNLTQNTQVLNPNVNQIYGWNPYFEMFSMPNPGTLDEVLMWRQFDANLSITHGFMAYINEGGNNGMTKSYVDAFLMANGLPIYAANSGYKGDVTIDQQKADRDGRLQLFVFGESTVLNNEDSLSFFNVPTVIALTEHRDRTGFRQRKHLCYDFTQIRNGVRGTNGIVVARATEAYLNYIEASYMKNGSIDGTASSYWRRLRERAGVDPDFSKTIAATDLSKEPDWAVYSGSDRVDPTLYNIRRERRCEFIGEGRRWDDLIRWRSFDALFTGNMGKYIPEGVNFWTEMYKDKSYLKKDSNGNITSESALIEQADGKNDANISSRNDSKYIRPYRVIKENNEVWEGYQWKKAYYLAPYSVLELTLASPDSKLETSNLYQNPYWPTMASSPALE